MNASNTKKWKIERGSQEYYDRLFSYMSGAAWWVAADNSHDPTTMIKNFIARAKWKTPSYANQIDPFINKNKALYESVVEKMEADLWITNGPNVAEEGEQSPHRFTGHMGFNIAHLLSWIWPDQELALRDQLLHTPLEKFENKSLKDLIDKVSTVDDIKTIEAIILEIKSLAEFANAPETLRKSLAKELESQKVKICTSHISTQLDGLEWRDHLSLSVTELLWLTYQLEELKELRASLHTLPNEDDERIIRLSKKITDLLKQSETQVLYEIDQIIIGLQSYCDKMVSIGQLSSIYWTPEHKHYRIVKQILPAEQQDLYDEKLKVIISTNWWRLEEKTLQEQRSSEKKKTALIAEIDTELGILQWILRNINEIKEVQNMSVQDPLVEHLEELIENRLLSQLEQEQYRQKINALFKARQLELKLERNTDTSLGLWDLNIDPSLSFQEHETTIIGYKVKAIPIGWENNRLELHLENWTSHIFDINLLNNDIELYGEAIIWPDIKTFMTQEEFIKYGRELGERKKHWKTEYMKLKLQLAEVKSSDEKDKELIESLQNKIKALQAKYKQARYTDLLVEKITHKLNINPRPYLQKPNHKFIVLDEEKDIFRNLSYWLVAQQETQKGIDILEGPPGLGKTELCRYLAAVTNRQIVRVQCSKMDPSDMFFSPQLKAWETSRQPADWIKLMQQPGVIVLFDEVDKLNDQCFEKLHSLFDSWRSVYDPQLGMIKANKDCLFLWTRNSYDRLSNPIVSRSTITYMYPPSILNEAFKVSKYSWIPLLENMDFEQFKELYTELETWAGDKLSKFDKQTQSMLINTVILVKVFQELRTKQVQDNRGDSFQYEISYRDAEQIFARFRAQLTNNYAENKAVFEKTLKDILVPKARAVVLDRDDKKTQEKFITDAMALAA